ncbi:DMT family transporter [uncultured Desulfosarcina sp.]|uniref:DMT family transporter n=1 Tax=uncultured Desulfosarcina sp. TaxID=218289 RepID=UPI0029C6DAE6|nr:DMT family transporter [uncultured Desulfosarcina sp.]
MVSDNTDITLFPGIFIIFLTVIFGGNTVAIKLALTGMGPLTSAGLRFALAAVAIACWARATDRSFCIQTGQAFQLLIVSLAFTVQLSLFYLGLDRTYASRGVLISNLLPFFVLFLSHRFIPGERITWKKMTGIVLGFAGVAFMFTGTPGISGSLHTGDLIILAAVMVWSCNVVYTKRIINDYSPFHLVLYPMIFSVPIFLSAGFLWDDRMLFNLNPMVIGAYAYQSLVSAAFGFVAWSTMLQRYGASTLHAFVFIMPIAGVVFSGFLLHEPITPNLIVAMVFIAVGILMIHVGSKKPTFSFPLGRGV